MFRKNASSLLLFFCGLLCAGWLLWPLFSSPAAPAVRRMEVVFLNVGQADSALIITPLGNAVLVDAGADACARNVDEGGRLNAAKICAVLAAKGVRRLDTVAVSHTDMDHIGALPEIFERVPVRRIVAPVPEREDFFACLPGARTEAEYIFAGAGDYIDIDPDVRLACLLPDKAGLDMHEPANRRSLVFSAAWGMFSVLFTGDIDARAIARLRPRLEPGWTSVLKFPHHGAWTPELEGLIARARPRLAVLSCGRLNLYSHPDGRTLSLLAARGVAWARTDRNGHVTVVSDGRSFCVETERQDLRAPEMLDA